MKKHVTNLGGVVNKDMAFSKASQDLVYDSQNFRITANDDGTLAVRTNIKGNVNVVSIPTTNAQWKLQLTETSFLVSGFTYTLELDGANTINDVSGGFSWTFTFISVAQFYQDLAAEINAQSGNVSSFLYFSSASVSSGFDFVEVTGPLTFLTVLSFTQAFPVTGQLITNGNFSTNPSATWTYGSAWVWDSINLEMDATLANGDTLIQSGLAFIPGQIYNLQFTVTVAAGDLFVLAGYPDPNQWSSPLITASGTYNYTFTYLSPVALGNIVFFPGNNFTGSVDNVSIQVPDYASYLSIVEEVPVLNNLKIIGWTTLRDDIILITTNGTFDPDDPSTGPFTSYGQLWRLSYDKGGNLASGTNYSLTLLYNKQLNLTVHRPIANPGMIEARYESSTITPVYWTDNYNPPRRANVADPVLATYNPERLNLLPALNMNEPKLTEMVQQGNLKTGVYQFAYRLKNINGAESKFSRPSKLIPIIEASELGQYIDYFPKSVYDPLTNITSTTPGTAGDNVGGNSGKSVRLLFENLDLNYDTIEIVSIYYQDNVTFPEAYIVKIDAVPSSGTYQTVVDSTSNDIPITIDELTSFNSSIIRCKTLASKVQTLFLGNIKTSEQDVDFDARTYRFPKTAAGLPFNETIIKNNGVSYTLTNSAPDVFQITAIASNPVIPYDVPEEHDAVQDYDMQSPYDHQNCLYIPGTDVLGGEGPSIKYTFVTEQMLLDETGLSNRSLPYKNPGVSTFTIDNINGGTVEQVSTFSDNSSPYLYDVLVGYRRDEMERFGIVFFDEYDNPSFVKWIGDIRMPHQFMANPSIGNPRTMLTELNYLPVLPEGDINVPGGDSFRSTVASLDYKIGTSGEQSLHGNILGLRITIKNFTGIPARYKKAGIVRVPKQDEDRHIIGQGFFRPTYKTDDTAQSNSYIFTASCDLTGISRVDYDESQGNTWPYFHTFVSPEFLFKSRDNIDFVQDDKIDVIGIYRKSNLGQFGAISPFNIMYINALSGLLDPQVGNGNGDKFFGILTKNYFIEETPTSPHPIKSPLSENPYPLEGTIPLFNKFLYNRGYNTDFGGAYKISNSIATSTLSPREIFNCTVKNPFNGTWFPNNSTDSDLVFSHCNDSLFLQLKSGWDNWNTVGNGGENFLAEDYMGFNSFGSTGGAGIGIRGRGMNGYMANYIREVSSQFGGNSYSSRANSEYISTGCVIDITDTTSPITTKVFGGDTTVAVMDYMMQFIDQSNMALYGASLSVLAWACLFPCETSVAVNLRRTFNNNIPTSRQSMVTHRSRMVGAYNENDPVWSIRPNVIDLAEYFMVDRVYNYSDKHYMKFFPKPYLNIPVTEFDCRVWRSEKKIDASIIDTWGIFKSSAYLDVESKYGPLNNLIVFKDKLLYFQDKAFGQLQVADQKLINSATGGADLVLGASGILERYDYISTQTGTKHQFSMSVSDYSLIWFDTLARKIYKLGDGLSPVTDLKGYHAYVYANTGGEIQNNDNPYLNKGVHSTYDYRFGEFYMTFLSEDKKFTLVYNDMFEGFVGEYTHYPVVYINDKSNIFSVPYSTLASRMWIHNYGNYGSFYGNNPVPSKISFLVNPSPTEEKVFTNMEMLVESFKTPFGYEEPDFYDFFDTMRVYDNYQNTDILPLSNLSTKHKTIWDIKVPSDRVLDVTQPIFNAANLSTVRPPLTRRMKDKWFMVDMTYNNTDNNKFVVHYNTAIYMPNSR